MGDKPRGSRPWRQMSPTERIEALKLRQRRRTKAIAEKSWRPETVPSTYATSD